MVFSCLWLGCERRNPNLSINHVFTFSNKSGTRSCRVIKRVEWGKRNDGRVSHLPTQLSHSFRTFPGTVLTSPVALLVRGRDEGAFPGYVDGSCEGAKRESLLNVLRVRGRPRLAVVTAAHVGDAVVGQGEHAAARGLEAHHGTHAHVQGCRGQDQDRSILFIRLWR